MQTVKIQELTHKLNRWKDGLANKGVKVNTSKTKIMTAEEKTRVVVTGTNGHVQFVLRVSEATQYQSCSQYQNLNAKAWTFEDKAIGAKAGTFKAKAIGAKA